MLNRSLVVVLCLALFVTGCGQPFHVVSEPHRAEIWVDGKYVGRGAAYVPTNGVVFNSYTVEAKNAEGKVLAKDEVNTHFGARSAVFFIIGLCGIVFWPLLPFIPLAFFVGDPSPEHLHLRVPDEEQPKAPPRSDADLPEPDLRGIDRPILQVSKPQLPIMGVVNELTINGRARHWSGVQQVTVQYDGRVIATVKAGPDAEVELPFEVKVPFPMDRAHHVVKVTARGLRGSEAAEELTISGLSAPPPEKVPGLEPVPQND